MEFQTLKIDIADHIAVVTLNRPPVNALNVQMRNDLIEAFDNLSDIDEVRAIVLTGSGKVFCAGADIRDRPDVTKTGAYGKHNRLTRESYFAVVECTKPMIAAINGPALGAGFGLVMASDIWVASEAAVVSLPEINVGLAGGMTFLHRYFSQSRARRMFYTGMQVSAAELYRLGLVEACLPPDQLMPYCMDIARELCDKAPIALAKAKEAARLTPPMPQRDAYRWEQNITATLAATEDTKEAQRAIFEKRKPVCKGR